MPTFKREIPHHLAPPPLPIITMSEDDIPTALMPKPVAKAFMPTSAAHRVLNTTELLEMILLHNELEMHQLYVCQRVNKKFGAVMGGSQKLRVKMFLEYTSEDLGPQEGKEAEWLQNNKDVASLFNPLTGPIKTLPCFAGFGLQYILISDLARLSKCQTAMALPVFRHFNIVLHPSQSGHATRKQSICFSVCHPSPEMMRRQLRPRLEGSWRRMKIAKIPFNLKYGWLGNDWNPQVGSHSTLGDFVDILLEYYDRVWRGSHPPQCSLSAEIHFGKHSSNDLSVTGNDDG